MRHFDTWALRDPYSIWHYYPGQTSDTWTNTVRDLIISRAICSPSPHPNPSPPIDIYTPTFNHQPQSPLSLLPPEIRSMIWSYVFPPATLHLVTVKNKLRHLRCPQSHSQSQSQSQLTHHRHCCPTTPARWRVYDGRVPGHSDRVLYPHTHEKLPDMVSNSNVALLRTCRAIYAETADLIYRNSTFDVDDLYTFIAFCNSISVGSRNAISRLVVQWMPVWEPLAGMDHSGSIYAHTHSDALWIGFWEKVGGLRGLQYLGLSVDLGRFTGTITGGGAVVVAGQRLELGLMERWLRPLLDVRGLKGFELAVTARCDEAAKGVIEGGLVRDAGVLRDQLRAVMCSGVGVALEDVEGLGVDLEGEMVLKVEREVKVKGGLVKRGPLLIEA